MLDLDQLDEFNTALCQELLDAWRLQEQLEQRIKQLETHSRRLMALVNRYSCSLMAADHIHNKHH